MRHKSRLTITLPNDLLKAVDAFIDGSIIRNRSHAVESLINQSLENPVETAVILTGGDRYSPNPCLKKIGTVSLINLTLARLASAGVKNVIICLGQDGESVRMQVGIGEPFGLNLTYVAENSPSGTGGALLKTRKLITCDNFLVLHGDIINNLNIENFVTFHRQEGTIATIVVMPKIGDKSFGKAVIEGNQIIAFYEKTNPSGIDIINTGIYIFTKKIFNYLTSANCRLEKDIFPLIAKQMQLTAFLFQGFWADISNPKEYKIASAMWGKLPNK